MVRKFFVTIAMMAVITPAFAQPKETPEKPEGPPATQKSCIYKNIQYSDGAIICSANNFWQMCVNGTWSNGTDGAACRDIVNGEKR